MRLRSYLWQREITPMERQAGYFNWLLTRDTHAKEVRLFDLGTLFSDRFRQLRTKLRQERLDLTTRRTVAEMITQSGAIIAAFGLYGFLALRALRGLVTMGDLADFLRREGPSSPWSSLIPLQPKGSKPPFF